MLKLPNAIVAVLIIGFALCGAALAGDSEPVMVKVLYLQGMEVKEAVTLLRSRFLVPQLATIPDRNLVIIAEAHERGKLTEDLLLEEGAISKVTYVHKPLDLSNSMVKPDETRTFRVEPDATGSVVTILRAIYQVRNFVEAEEAGEVTVTAAGPVLDSCKILLSEVGLLTE